MRSDLPPSTTDRLSALTFNHLLISYRLCLFFSYPQHFLLFLLLFYLMMLCFVGLHLLSQIQKHLSRVPISRCCLCDVRLYSRPCCCLSAVLSRFFSVCFRLRWWMRSAAPSLSWRAHSPVALSTTSRSIPSLCQSRRRKLASPRRRGVRSTLFPRPSLRPGKGEENHPAPSLTTETQPS